MNNLNDKLARFVTDPKNPRYNFLLGNAYEDMGHTAAAAGYYLRTAEFAGNDLLIYEALLRMALCFNRQGSRVFTVKGVLLRAISLLPARPEAYFLLSRTYEVNREWGEAYTWATLGEGMFCHFEINRTKLITNVEYPGLYGFTFEKAVAGWWIGLYDESLHLFRQLSGRTDLTNDIRNSVRNNLDTLMDDWKEPLTYDESMYERLRVKFNGARDIKNNYSQCYQDMFVLTMLNGKREGKYLEIGGGDPFYGNNTALLEKDFLWHGISIDISKEATEKFEQVRAGVVIIGDATRLDYHDLLNDDYDYLQIDCDPALTSLEVLLRIPFEKHRFAVITFEHDHYADETSGVRDRSRDYLRSQGYELIVTDIAPDKFRGYEDWWVHPEMVDAGIVVRMKDNSNSVKRADNYMLT
jgi:tetratricopeptide (TPR) repeat protein